MMSIDRVIQQLSLLKNRTGLRKIVVNISWLVADRILRMGFGLVVGVWVARYLGVRHFVILNYATAFVSIFNPLATLGLDMGIDICLYGCSNKWLVHCRKPDLFIFV